MDYQFPRQLFPSLYVAGPPDTLLEHNAGDLGSWGQVRAQGGPGPLSSLTFTPKHKIKGETWRQTEPVPVPLLSPKNFDPWPSTLPDPRDFTKHMQNFYLDHHEDAFGCMSEMLVENFDFDNKKARPKIGRKNDKSSLDMLKSEMLPQLNFLSSLTKYSELMSDVVHDVPPDLLASLLYEELTQQREHLLFPEAVTGGAMAFVPFSQSSSSSQAGCLLYPGNRGLDCLNFHRVELTRREGSPCVDGHSSEPVSFQLTGPIRQISSASVLSECCVAVRSNYLCGVWRLSESSQPRLLQVANTSELATCISVSPHVLGEVLVASERGATMLWTVGGRMHLVREEDNNLYFNANSSWRWCEFSAHPRVMLYADRTGVDLTDIRGNPAPSHTLFRISSNSDCRYGERVILSRYLGDTHSFHHLITTQFSAYIMDERFPNVPMLKWDHMMQSPPMFCHIVPGSSSSGLSVGSARSTKVVLGSSYSQEVTMMQYSGGKAEACFSCGPTQFLLTPGDSLKHLPVQIPHRLDLATSRLSSPATGLTCIQMKGGSSRSEGECLCILQLTEAGDIFYQILEPEQSDALDSDSEVSHSQAEGSIWTWFLEEEGNAEGLAGAGTPAPSGFQPVGKVNGSTLLTWKRWLHKLMKKPRKKRLHRHRLIHTIVDRGGFLSLEQDMAEEERMQSLGRHLRLCMSQGSVLVRSTFPSSLQPLELVPMPVLVDPDAWTDPLSQRLTVSWQGQAAWRDWWDESLGRNKEAKMKALRTKRLREKAARRASGRSLDLSGSFTSSTTYQTEWDSFSDSVGWSSAASQGARSNMEDVELPAESCWESRASHPATPSSLHMDNVVSTPASTAQSVKDNFQETPSSFQALSPPQPTHSSCSNQRRRRRLADDYLSSLFSTQEDTLLDDPFLQDTESPAAPAASSSSQPLSLRPTSQRSLRPELSQDTIRWFSSLSQSSQPSLGLSQASQPKKKRSRMGF